MNLIVAPVIVIDTSFESGKRVDMGFALSPSCNSVKGVRCSNEVGLITNQKTSAIRG